MLDTKHTLECDILVAGGGPAGVPCALAAARNGAKVILCQDRPVLGGNASSEVRMHIVGADALGRGEALKVEARESGIMEEIRLDCAVQNPQRSNSILDLILYDKCRQEPNLQLMLNTAVVGAKTENNRITEAIAIRTSTEDRYTIRAKIFIDCTGDGRLGAEAGAPFQMGREGRNEFGEDMAATESGDNLKLGSTLLYTARKHDRPMTFTAPSWVRKFTKEEISKRLRLDPNGHDAGLEYGYWWAEWGGHLDTIKENEDIREELLAITLGVWNYVKNHSNYPGIEYWALEWCGFLPGKRESRRFHGLHKLTQSDVMGSNPQPDAIAFGGWPIDTHPPMGVDALDEPACVQTHVPKLYDIPLRACISSGPENLMFAGRNISATHIAFASTRVMATCAAMGQGVGTAAAHAVHTQRTPVEISSDTESIRAIQQQLVRDDAYLIGIYNEDTRNLSPKAHITASSERPDSPATNIISGQNRAVDGEEGAPSGRCIPGTNRWISDAEKGLPASITLKWDEPVSLGQIELIFDTGMHQRLSLTQCDSFARKMQWGKPQAETVRDYTIEALDQDGLWQVIESVEGNYQRHRIHPLSQTVKSNAIRIQVTATNGINEARIFDVRALASD